MNKCKFIDFMQMIEPWLNAEYIHQARLDPERKFTLMFVDGGYKTYEIDGCSSEQLEDTIEHLKKNGIRVIR